MHFRPGSLVAVLSFAPVAVLLTTLLLLGNSAVGATESSPLEVYVNGAEGTDSAIGDRQHPLKSLSAAISRLPDPLLRSVRIEWVGEMERTTGGRDMASDSLELMRRMRPGVRVSIIGQRDRAEEWPKMGWEGGAAMVDAREGDWWLE